MEPLIAIPLESIDSSFNNTSVDKELRINYNDFLEKRHNFGLDNNISHDSDIQINNKIFGSLIKKNIDEKNNKDEISENENDDEVYFIKPNKGDKNEKKQKKLLGRKKKEETGSGEHNKFTDDNLRRKIKHLVLDSTFKFINEKIKKIYNGKIGHGIYTKKLLKLNHKQISDSLIKFNKDFLTKTLGEIFSEDISSKYATYHPKHNKFLIIALTLDKDEEKKNYFKKLFSITFVDCLKHFRGSQKIEELKGLKEFKFIKSKYKDDVNYLKSLKYYIMNYEEIINNKKARKSKKEENEINEQ